MKIAFFGTPRFAQIVLEKLIDSPLKPSLIVTAPDAKSGRGRQLQPSPVKKTAVKNRIEVLQPKSLSDPNFKFEILNLKFDIAILVAYGKIIPKEILKIPKYGFLNIHPSLLPKYRGPSPIQSAILAGEQKTGVSIICLDEEIDHGPLLAQQEVIIDPADTHDTLAEKLAREGTKLLLHSLPAYLEGNLISKPQDDTRATFTKHITKQDGYINLKNPPDPQTLDRMIRAYYPWPGVYTQLRIKNYEVRIKLLPHGQIQPEGKKPMTIKEFLNGYPQARELMATLHLI